MQRKTQQEKEDLLQLWSESGKSQAAFARSHAIKPNTFYNWMQNYRNQNPKQEKKQNKFIEMLPESPSETNKSTVIRYPNGIEIELSGFVNFQELKSLFHL